MMVVMMTMMTIIIDNDVDNHSLRRGSASGYHFLKTCYSFRGMALQLSVMSRCFLLIVPIWL